RAEDGIRDFHVTGVQTCALPIFLNLERRAGAAFKVEDRQLLKLPHFKDLLDRADRPAGLQHLFDHVDELRPAMRADDDVDPGDRSEGRRAGKGVRSWTRSECNAT